MIRALSRHAQKHAFTYLIGLALALGSSLTAFYDNFWPLTPEAWDALGWWQILALYAKTLCGGVLAIVAYFMKSPLAADAPTPPALNPSNDQKPPNQP